MAPRHLSAILWLLAATSPAFADDTTLTPAQKERQTLESYGAANAACQEWSDGCAVCARHGDGTFACSLPGIACEPGGLVCRPVAAVVPDGGAKPAAPNTPAK